MSDATMIGVIAGVGALMLVGSAVAAYRRRGAPVFRYGLMWAAILAGAFAISWYADHAPPR